MLCHKKVGKEGHLGETLSVTLPRAKPLSPKAPTRRALGKDGAVFRCRKKGSPLGVAKRI